MCPTLRKKVEKLSLGLYKMRQLDFWRVQKNGIIIPILRSLHWLPVRYRVEYKLLIFVYKSMNSLAPPYLSALLTEHRPSRSLRSSNQRLRVLSVKTKVPLPCLFCIVGPRLWNDLPTSIRMASSLSVFKSKLKTLYWTRHLTHDKTLLGLHCISFFYFIF